MDLKNLANKPNTFKKSINLNNETLVFRLLTKEDQIKLLTFYKNLSPQTKKFYSLDENLKETVNKIIDAIGKYDKLWFVLENQENNIIGLFEFSFDIPESDSKRFQKYHIDLNSKNDCRLGPILADEYQSKGLGSITLKEMVSIAKEFQQKRIILWGGVHQTNQKAINFYQKNNFKTLGEFKNQDDLTCIDMILEL